MKTEVRLANSIYFRLFLASTVLLLFTQPTRGETWVERMLATREHDFGTVATGSDAIYRFPIKNPYQHEIKLLGVRSSCGCTECTIENSQLRPGEIGYISADFNTRSFGGPHSANLTLEASWDDNGVQRKGEATVTVKGNIRGPIQVEPCEVCFTNVQQGSSPRQNLRISAEGNLEWQVKKVECTSENIETELSKPQRSPQHVIYDLLVRLSSWTPVGVLREQILIKPVDEAEPTISVNVSGKVVPDFWVAPENLFLGEVNAGQEIKKKMIIRSRMPCRVVSVRSDAGDLRFTSEHNTPERQILSVTFKVPSTAGQMKTPITITSDAGDTTTMALYSDVVVPK